MTKRYLLNLIENSVHNFQISLHWENIYNLFHIYYICKLSFCQLICYFMDTLNVWWCLSNIVTNILVINSVNNLFLNQWEVVCSAY